MNAHVVNVLWEGPLTFQGLDEKKGRIDHGVYQRYADHPVYGPNVLFSIGKAQKARAKGSW